MRIHKSDAKFIASINKMERMSWRDIMEVVRQRAIDRAQVLLERKTWDGIQNAAQESWE